MPAPQTPVSLLERPLLKPEEASVWEPLFQLHLPLLERWMDRFSLQAADGDDLVQDILVVLLRELPQFQHSGQPGAFRKWLRLITVHRCQDRLRSGKARAATGGDEL